MAQPTVRQDRSVQADGGGSVALAFASNVIANNHAVAGGGAWAQTFGTTVCTDSQGNTYTRQVGPVGASATTAVFTTLLGTSAANTITVDPTGTADDVTVCIAECTDLDNSALVDATQTNTGTGNPASGNIVTSDYNSLILGFVAHEGTTGATSGVSGGFTLLEEQTNGGNVPMAMVSRVAGHPGTYSTTITWAAVGASAYAFGSIALKATDQTPPPLVPEFRAAGTVAETVVNNGNLSVAMPAGTVEDDIIVIPIYHKDNITLGLPSDFAIKESLTNGSINKLTVAWKRAGAGETGPYAFTRTGTLLAIGRAASFYNCSTDLDPWDDTSIQANASSNTVSMASITTTVDNCMVLAVVGRGDDYTTSAVTGGTDPTFQEAFVNETTTGTDASLRLDYGLKETAGSVGARTSVFTGTAALNIGALMALKPVSTGVSGSASLTFGTLTLTATGTLPLAAAASLAFGALATTATGVLPIVGQGAPSFGALSLTATGTVAVQGQASLSFGALTLSGVGVLPVAGQSDLSFDALSVAATGTLPLAGQADLSFDALALTATGELPLVGAADLSFGALTLTATGEGLTDIEGNADLTFGALALTSTGVLPIEGHMGGVLDRAARVAEQWEELGALDHDSLREFDILYNPDDGLYYVFNTEMAGGPPPVDPDTSAAYEWNIASSTPGNPTLVTLSTPHHFATGTRRYAVTFAGTSVTGLSGLKLVTAPSSTTLLVHNSTSSAASAGTVTWGVTLAYVGMRKAATPELIDDAVDPEYISRVASGIYYPSVVKTGTGAGSVWYMFGYNGSGDATIMQTFSGASPSAMLAFGSAQTLPMLLGDIDVALNPADGLYYAVGNTSDTVTALWVNDDIADVEGWTEVSANVWAEGTPAWAASNKPNPNLGFWGGEAFLLFTSGAVAGEWSTGITRLNLTTGRVYGEAVLLQEFGEYEAWQQDGAVLSDLTLVEGADGELAIYAATNHAFDYEGLSSWGALDLTVSVFGALSLTATGGALIQGSADLAFDPLSLSGTGVLPITGVGSLAFGTLALEAAGTLSISGQADLGFDALGTVATGSLPIVGAASLSFDALALEASGVGGEPPIVGSADLTFGALSVAGTGALLIRGEAALTFDALSVAGAGELLTHGVGDLLFAELALSAQGTLSIAGAGAPAFGALELDGTGALLLQAEAELLFGALALTARGREPVPGFDTAPVGRLEARRGAVGVLEVRRGVIGVIVEGGSRGRLEEER